jgi:hypothetical protein
MMIIMMTIKTANLTPWGKVNYEELKFFQYTQKLPRF